LPIKFLENHGAEGKVRENVKEDGYEGFGKMKKDVGMDIKKWGIW
jgi:hypothetical protein